MDIFSSILVGTAAGGVASLVYRAVDISRATSVAVGILGGLFGLASHCWLGMHMSAYWASGLGALVTLFLWIVAQRLFLGDLPEQD